MKSFIAILLILACLVSCGSDGNPEVNPDQPDLPDNPPTANSIAISAMINAVTELNESTFNKDDQISVYAYQSGNPDNMIINNAINTFDGSLWASSVPMKWKNTTTSHDFMALFPTRAITSYTDEILALTDVVSKNDILVATKTNVVASTEPVPLAFDHIMTKIHCSLVFNNELGGAPVVQKVVLKTKKQAAVNYLTKTVTTTGRESDMILTPSNVSNVFIGVTAPQTVIAGNTMLEVYMDGESKPYLYIPETDIILQPKTMQEIRLVVGLNQIKLDKITINDWGRTESIDGGAIQ